MIGLVRTFAPSIAALVGAGAVAVPAVASAKSWKHVVPGATPEATVVKRFGEPTTRLKRGDQKVLAYEGDEVLEGTKQSQFIIGADGRVAQIAIFPAAVLDITAVTNTYGPSCGEKAVPNCFVQKVSDDFKTYDWYESLGLVVFLNPDGKTVQSFLYVKPGPARSTAPAGKPSTASPSAASKPPAR